MSTSKKIAISMQTDFSLRSLVDIIGKDKNVSLKLETNYLEDDFDDLLPHQLNRVIIQI